MPRPSLRRIPSDMRSGGSDRAADRRLVIQRGLVEGPGESAGRAVGNLRLGAKHVRPGLHGRQGEAELAEADLVVQRPGRLAPIDEAEHRPTVVPLAFQRAQARRAVRRWRLSNF
jgi:hypothetical protein